MGIINKKDSIAGDIYKLNFYNERFRHNYKINIDYVNDLEKHGLIFTGTSRDGKIKDIAEVPTNNFHIGVQFHPELNSYIFKPNPVILSFIKSFKIFA